MPRFDDRFARQNRFGPPSGFPLTSSYPGIVHHLSGPNIYALTQTFHQRIMVGQCCHPASARLHTFYFHCALWVCHPNTRIYVRLLGPCFKTGQLRPFCQDLDCTWTLPTHNPRIEGTACSVPQHGRLIDGRPAIERAINPQCKPRRFQRAPRRTAR